MKSVLVDIVKLLIQICLIYTKIKTNSRKNSNIKTAVNRAVK